MELNELDIKIKNLEKELESALKILNKAKNESRAINNKLRKLKEKRDIFNLSNMTLENADWGYLLSDAELSTKTKYNKMMEMLSQLRKKYNLNWTALFNSGYFIDTGQTKLTVSLIYDNPENTKNVIEALKVLLPHIKPLKDGYKHFSIFESTLSEYSSYNLLIDKNGLAKISKGSKYSSEIYKWETLENTIKCIEQNHYYQVGE